MRSKRSVLGLLVAFAIGAMALAAGAGAKGGATKLLASKASSSTLTIAASTGGPFPQNLNPVAPVSGLSDATSFVYEPLLQFDKLKPGVVKPWLATKYTWSNGGKTLTFKIRHGVRWNDGTPLTSADVAFTYNYVKANPAINLQGLRISSVSAPNSSTVVLKFATPQYANLFYIGSQYILPKHIWQGIKDPSSATNLHPVGTGPYMVSSFNAQNLTLVKNPKYWQHGKPAINEIVFPSTDSNTGPGQALLQNSAQWGGIFFPEARQYSKQPGDHFWFPPMSDAVLILNLKKAPMNSLAFRRAIDLTLKRQTIENDADLGLVQAVSNPTMLTPYQRSFLAPQYAHAKIQTNLSKAKAILVKAGFKYKGKTLMDPGGKPVTLTLNNPGPLSDLLAAGQAVATELGSLGISVTQVSDSVAQWQADQTTGNYDIAVRPSVAGPGPYYMYNYWLNSSLSAPIGKVASGDFERFSNPVANKLLTEYASTDSSSKQKQIMYKLEGIVVNQLPVIPLLYQAFWGEYNTKQFTGWPNPSNPYALASVYDLPGNEMVILNLKPNR
jgi:peptide/nickel transport system substrate-binding protein